MLTIYGKSLYSKKIYLLSGSYKVINRNIVISILLIKI